MRFKLTPSPIKCSCVECKIETVTSALARHHHFAHQHLYPKAPNAYGSCPSCGQLVRGYNKKEFCSQSCSATFYNKQRSVNGYTMSTEAKSQLSVLMKTRRINQPELYAKGGKKGRRPSTSYEVRNCPECGTQFEILGSNTKKYCSPRCVSKNIGGARQGSGRAKSGFYKGIYCGSTYELAWVVYRLDHNLPVNRFPTYIGFGNNQKYFPDFIDGDTIYEMKGRCTDDVALKTNAAVEAGYNIVVLYKDDLVTEFRWAQSNYEYKHIQELYDDHKPAYQYKCAACFTLFNREVKARTDVVFCSRECSGQGHKGRPPKS